MLGGGHRHGDEQRATVRAPARAGDRNQKIPIGARETTAPTYLLDPAGGPGAPSQLVRWSLAAGPAAAPMSSRGPVRHHHQKRPRPGRAAGSQLGAASQAGVIWFAGSAGLPVSSGFRDIDQERVVSQMSSGPAILVEGLTKSFGDVRALRGIDLSVPRGHGARRARPERRGQDHRGAHPDHAAAARTRAGRWSRATTWCGEAAAVRRSIGLSGQSAAIQEELTGRENLEIIGRLYHLSWPRPAAGPPSCWSSSA